VLYAFLKIIIRLFLPLIISLKVKGGGNVPKNGGLLIISNHLSVFDPVLIAAYVGRRPSFMAKEEIFRNKLTNMFIRYLGGFPVYRGSFTRDALRHADKILKNGEVLGMFPEGKRSYNNSLQPALLGSALVATHNRMVILPVGITGTEKVRGFGWIWHRPQVTINIGFSFILPEPEKSVNKEVLEANSKYMMEQIANLLPPVYQGVYANRSNK
jgi:1-acyl-sn-glycerol-3-phosphate acyltransferase